MSTLIKMGNNTVKPITSIMLGTLMSKAQSSIKRFIIAYLVKIKDSHDSMAVLFCIQLVGDKIKNVIRGWFAYSGQK
ncbi:hypothetical protein BG259_22775 [Vibrio harveyi]|nr:hypothetical protein BG259_22775 [Vibrio harveyi]